MKLLVAIKSCWRDLDAGHHTAIRETWGKDLVGKADLRFFVGAHPEICGFATGGRTDEVVLLGIPDDYDGLPLKTIAICKWAIARNYDYVYLCDTDTFVCVERLLACGFESVDYLGRFGVDYTGVQLGNFHDCRLGEIGPVWPFASGGVGYFLSRPAMEVVVEMPLVHWAEDFCVAQALGPLVAAGKLRASNPQPFDWYVATHYCRTGIGQPYSPQWQYNSYNVAKTPPQGIMVMINYHGGTRFVPRKQAARLVDRGVATYAGKA